MRKLLLFTALVVLTTRAFCREKVINFECGDVDAGKSATYNETYPINSRFAAKVIVSITATNTGSKKSPSCKVSWSVSISNAHGEIHSAIHHSEEPDESIFGSGSPVLSADGTKLLVPFWTAEGDYTGYRAAVYDFTSQQALVRIIADRITRNLPSCDYYTVVEGIRNDGNVIIHVPKSIYVEEGCEDQGQWLLNMKTDRLTRLKRKHAIPKKSSH